jgi:hypothetical protein
MIGGYKAGVIGDWEAWMRGSWDQLKAIEKLFIHHRDTEVTEKTFFIRSGDTDRIKPLCPAGNFCIFPMTLHSYEQN